MRQLAILGASGHGKVVAETALRAGWSSIDFYDDAWPAKRRIGKWLISGDTESLLRDPTRFDGAVVAIGHNAIRMQKMAQLRAAGFMLATIAHPAATVSESAQLGAGTVIMAGVIVNADAGVGAGAILNTGCSVDHDCVLAECVHVSPGARLAGDVRVGECTWIGIGASIRQGVIIGRQVTVGAGATVVGDIADNLTVVGVPAKPLGTASEPLLPGRRSC